ncbi:MAG TPA: DotA/TraY family protein [Alphaproteobacteria bacterium]|nr:DotA/TraY family protein [Alphaproteobacteria bacterium]
MAEAANNLVFDRKHIDQIIIYFTILVGLILLGLQFILLIVAITAEHPALALGITDLFPNPNTTTGSLGPEQDIAFILLDRIFGLTGFFNSCISNLGVPCTDLKGVTLSSTPTAYPFPFHIALHRILQFYAYGIFWVGSLVIIYLCIAIIAETAASGTPFGQRFNKAWAPVRLILFFALLVPMNWAGGPNQGLNAAQLITFKIVQLGSNMATNAWTVFNGGGPSPSLSANYLSQQYDLVAQPNTPISEVNDLLQTMYLARTCAAAYHLQEGPEKKIDAYVVRSTPPANITPTINGATLTPNALDFNGLSYPNALDFAYRGTITIRFGRLGEAGDDPAKPGELSTQYQGLKGNVKPYCGEVMIQVQGIEEPGANMIFNVYYDLVKSLWNDQQYKDRSECFVKHKITEEAYDPNCSPIHDETWVKSEIAFYVNSVKLVTMGAIQIQRAQGDFAVPTEIIERGWAGAAIWYNKIAAMNGAITTASLNIPKASLLPLLMETAMRNNRQQNELIRTSSLFNQNMADAMGVNVLMEIKDDERNMLTAMVEAYEFWTQNGSAQQSNFDQPTGNIIIDYVNSLFGTNGLFEMRNNTNVHPLAQLSALGKSMMEAVVRNAAYGAALSGVKGLGFKLDQFAEGAGPAGNFLFALVIITVGIAAILYYVLPFLPFIYFMFAVSGWIKSIFEAIVAMPLWALAHLRIDGEGVVGPGATNGYFLLLEIFLRPTLIIFGFVASISIFSALVNVLNQIFDLVIGNLGGYDEELEANIVTGSAPAGTLSNLNIARGTVDEFFFTAMYAIICYLIGLSCFKLVDLIPNNILRWMGVSVSTFQENAGDPAGKLSSNVYKGTLLIGNQVRGTAKGDLAIIAD